jgi:Ca-activated chloride channel homolog
VNSVSLHQPAWLLLLVLLPLLGAGALLVSRLRKRQWSAFVAPRLREALLMRGSPLPRWFALVFLLAACAALIVALARPRADAGTRTERTLGRNVLIALDLSRSMRVADVRPDRLAQAKIVIHELLDVLPNERVGLMGFAGDAYLYAPLTVDHRAVRETVDQIDESWAPFGGSDLSEALKLAIETLKKTGQKNNALVILSDGEKHDGDISAMISEAARSGVYILAVGIGTEDGGYVPDPSMPGRQMVDRNGRPVLSRLQPEVMRQLAEETKGRFAVAGSGADLAGMVKAAVQDMDTFEMEGRERRVAVEFYQWLLLPAIGFLMVSLIVGTRWRGIRSATAVAAVLVAAGGAPRLRAEGVRLPDDVAEARRLLEAGDHAAARDAYSRLARSSRLPARAARFRLGEAAAAYRAGEFKRAREASSKALLSDDPQVAAAAHLGLGKSLFQLGWRDLAGEDYPADPASAPDLERFDELVRDRLAGLLESDDDALEDAGGYAVIESIVSQWGDAVRHFQSALAVKGGDPAAAHNRDLALRYLKRLRELLEEEKEQTEQSMPQPGQGPPQQGDDGEPGEDGEPGPKGSDPGNGESGEGDQEHPEGSSGEDQQKPGEEPEKPGEGEKDQDKDGREGETPEERARRILNDNADTEKGPLSPGRIEFRPPEKDW